VRESSLQQTIGSNKAPLSVEIAGDDLNTLQQTTEQLAEFLQTVEGLHTIETSFQRGLPELNMKVDRTMAASFGLDVQQVGEMVRQRLSGEIATDFFAEGNDRDIRVTYPYMTQADLEKLQIQTSNGALLRLTDIATLLPNEGPREIQRRNQSRIAHVTAQMTEETKLSEAVTSVTALLSNFPLPDGYQMRFTGEEASRRESFGQMKFALVLSVILVYMVLASLFESLLHPFTIMLTLPLAGVGVVFAFLLIGEPFSVMAYIGIIMLAGIAANDSIVLVDYVNRLRGDGATVTDALMQAGRDRLRPILMTSATTILALLPMTIGIGEGAGLRAPMAVAVIGGLVTSTILTLVVIPVVYTLIERLRNR
jgi:HAE1 family hydrophobic/amphiphilic exporter-1